MKNIELRMNSFNVIENDEDGKLTVQGYVNETGKQSHLLGTKKKFKEIIQKGAFTRALKKGNDIHFLAEHDENKILASTRNGSLTLKEDEKGLLMTADISDTSYGRDYHTLIKDGILRNMSFGFTVDKDKWNKEKDGTYTREVNDLTLFEVSVVTNPAYPQTTISARGLNVLEDVEIPQDTEERAYISGVWEDRDILNTALNIIGDVSTLLQYNKKSDVKVVDGEVEQSFNGIVLSCSDIISNLNESIDLE
ncbi:HK97 family phage prohead protease [Terrisporobacter vanillatitrophus]|uniref:HK97 family phage prohead protease n=1 Tax=Terrisporobacter vanillatitrophus TaxID=3058402 RepID=UPI0033662C78